MKKYNLLIPMAGRGQRFIDKGYFLPKPLVVVDGKHMIEISMSSIKLDECNIIFCVRQDHINNFAIDTILRDKFGNDVSIIPVNEITEGAVSTCLLAKDKINNDIPLIIYTLDVQFEPRFDPNFIFENNNSNGIILTFKANDPAYSYVKEYDGKIIETQEKNVISDNAAVGVYCFRRGSAFVAYAEGMIANKSKTKGEYYISPLYNLLIKDGFIITSAIINKVYVMGTPDELDFYIKHVLRKFGNKPIALCSDHSGFESKKIAKKICDKLDIEYVDFGTYTDKYCDYHDFVHGATKYIVDNNTFGIGFCRSGQGVNIAANKTPGIISALTHDEYTAKYAIRHNCANFLAIPSKYVDKQKMEEMFNIWQTHTFDGGRHSKRIQKVLSNEKI